MSGTAADRDTWSSAIIPRDVLQNDPELSDLTRFHEDRPDVRCPPLSCNGSSHGAHSSTRYGLVTLDMS